LVLGAGGVARGVVLALIRDGVGQLTIANRTLSRAQRLCGLAGEGGVSSEAMPLAGDALAAAAATADLIVNCTTMGMSHGPDEKGMPLSWQQIPGTALVNDLVYNPAQTPLLREAARAGAPVLGGIHMLVYQGAASFELWTGKKAPVAVMLVAANGAMEDMAGDKST
jgi:shikimate dehydrogenase